MGAYSPASPKCFHIHVVQGKNPFFTSDLKDTQQTRQTVLSAMSLLQNKWCSLVARANIAHRAQERLSGDTEVPVWSSRLGKDCMVIKTPLLKGRNCLKVGREMYVKYI